MVICSAASVELTDTVRNPLGYYRNTTMNSRADRDDRHGPRDRPEGERTQRDFHLHIISSPHAFTARGVRLELGPHRRPGSRTCDAPAPALHSGPWLRVAESCRKEWS
jgi:hypothetical protein